MHLTALVNIVILYFGGGIMTPVLTGMSNAENSGKEFHVESVREITPSYLTLLSVFQIACVASVVICRMGGHGCWYSSQFYYTGVFSY